jgi:hypothetical protein
MCAAAIELSRAPLVLWIAQQHDGSTPYGISGYRYLPVIRPIQMRCDHSTDPSYSPRMESKNGVVPDIMPYLCVDKGRLISQFAVDLLRYGTQQAVEW